MIGKRATGSLAFRHIRTAMASISTAKSPSSTVSGIRSANQDPTGAPIIPATANSKPVGNSTIPRHALWTKPTRDVLPTVSSEIPTASRAGTPKPYTSSGTAKIAPNKTVAAEVDRKHVPGQDPRQAPAPVDVRLFAPEGGIAWNDASGDKSIEKPSRWALTTAGAADLAEDTAPPEWIDHEPIGQVSEQKYGAPEIESTLLTNAPAETQLLELFQSSKRKEVKSLVARSSIHVGLFQPFVDALRDSEQKANWKSHIEALRAAMALSPESANKVWNALVDQRGKPAATDLYEMLCSYSPEQIGQTPEQIKTGPIAKLINWLEDDSLDYRVLASRDLAEITGKQFMQNPAAKLPERTQNVKRWRARLEAGELKPSTAPAAP